jgi:hypothetical protein
LAADEPLNGGEIESTAEGNREDEAARLRVTQRQPDDGGRREANRAGDAAGRGEDRPWRSDGRQTPQTIHLVNRGEMAVELATNARPEPATAFMPAPTTGGIIAFTLNVFLRAG